jgi:hypothetical protein
MDNLPLDAVAHFIHSASKTPTPMVSRRPVLARGALREKVPHQLFTASHEADVVELDDKEIAAVAQHWVRSFGRTRALGYNRKIDSYKSAQRWLRAVYEDRVSKGDPVTFEPADLEIVDIRPKWLCDTFAFHPMMGFRKQRQAESIAHGCASTLRKFQWIAADPQSKGWPEAWGIKIEPMPRPADSRIVPDTRVPFRSGKCVFRSDKLCPFSTQGLADQDLLTETKRQLEEIYYACRRPETHESPRQ